MAVISTAHPNHNPAPITLEARRLEEKVIFITGASSGIGDAAARRFVAEGASVVVGARRKDRLDLLVDELTAEHGVVSSEMVPALTTVSGPDRHGGLGMARHSY